MIVDLGHDELIGILGEEEGLGRLAVWYSERTRRAEITTQDGMYLHPCHNFQDLLKHVQECDDCKSIYLNGLDPDNPVWKLDCGYVICRSSYDLKRLFRLMLGA